MYPGTLPPGLYLCNSKMYDVVSRLITHISKSNLNVTFNKWFTSYPWMLNLLKEHQLASTGTTPRTKPRFLEKCCKFTIAKCIVQYLDFQRHNISLLTVCNGQILTA